MKSPSTRVINQNLVDAGNDGRLDLVYMKMATLNDDHSALRTLVERNEGRALGLSGTYLSDGKLQILAVADATEVILIDFAGDKNNARGKPSDSPLPTEGRDYLRDQVLGRTCGFLYAFDMGPLALALWQSHDLRITQAIDLQSAGPPKSRSPYATIEVATSRGNKDNVLRTFNALVSEKRSEATDDTMTTHLAQRAWVAHYISQIDFLEERLAQVPPIDTNKLSATTLRFLAKSVADSFQRDRLKPEEVTRTYATSFDAGKGQLRATADRYQYKIRKGQNQKVEVELSAANGVGAHTLLAEVTQTKLPTARLKVDGYMAGKQVAAITFLGRDDPTLAEVKRARIILETLQGKITDSGPWIHKIFFGPGKSFTWPAEWSESLPKPVELKAHTIPRPLNSSQAKAITSMLDETDSTRVTIIQGPPGTGKTTVIASYVLRAISSERSGIWLMAQSNIAVKNIAKKLMDFGLIKWRLLVADDFYVWHDHLYTNIRSNTIISGEFKEGRLSELHNCPVVLCTLGMVSSEVLKMQGAFERAPLQTVVIDEASQIEIGDYIPLFTNFSTIRKAIFIGDNMQLPPHGQDDIGDLQSIFEVDHLVKQGTSNKSSFIFLDTQYRMPPQIGDFIAQTVYPIKGKDVEPLLKSSKFHPLATEQSLLCYFVNVAGQQITQGTSFQNLEECKAIVKLAAIFQADKKKYRIITPYDSQRTLIEDGLKEADLEWGDKCFNVDSFQGNEEDYIIISLVRSRDLGFLADRRRVNVMLTRCKRGMIIFTNKAYIHKFAGPNKCLIGELIREYYEDSAWIEVGDLEKTSFV